jgi:hypothetical protein
MTHLVVIVLALLHVTAVLIVVLLDAQAAIHVASATQMLAVAVHHVAHVASLKLFDVNFN